jgi:hypothetical protein
LLIDNYQENVFVIREMSRLFFIKPHLTNTIQLPENFVDLPLARYLHTSFEQWGLPIRLAVDKD